MSTLSLHPNMGLSYHSYFLFFVLLFSFSPIKAQDDCSPFHITYSSDACPDFSNSPYPSNLDINLFRSMDGYHNNLEHIERGAAGTHFRRKQSQAFYYGDGHSMYYRNNPRYISNLIFEQNEPIPDEKGLSSLVFTFLQFIDHDITAIEGSELDFHPIPVPQGDPHFDPYNTGNVIIPFNRSAFETGTGTGADNPRQHVNVISAWVDGSMVYGSDFERAEWLRSGECGRLKVSTSPNGDLMPYNTITGEFDGALDFNAPVMAGDRDHSGQLQKVFVAGDVRANEQTGLTSLHVLFVREHNRICDELAADGFCNDEANYQYARKIVGGKIQSILYNELLPLLGINLPTYSYNPSMQPNIMHEFATAAFRLGHTMVTNEIPVRAENCEAPDGIPEFLQLKDAFFNPSWVANYGIAPFLRGLAGQTQEKIDAKVVNAVRNFLFGAPGAGGLDLASLNIQRGRDHGIPDYNKSREMFGLQKVESFDEITSDPDLSASLELAYGDVDNIDMWVGLLTEDHMPGKAVGRTLHRILKNQFRNLRDGDRFYYLNDPMLSNAEKWEIHETRLEDIIKANTTYSLAEAVFLSKDCESGVPGEDYCDASGEDTTYEWIESVKVNGHKVKTGNNNGYIDKTDETFVLEKESPNFIKLKPGFSGNGYREFWKVWIDLNRDGDFDDHGEEVFKAFRRWIAAGVIWLDKDIAPGQTLMRVAMSYNGYPESCGSFEFGEVEDYLVEIEAGSSGFRPTEEGYDEDISPIASIESLKAFPNPAVGNTTVGFHAKLDGKANLSLMNALGQIVLEETHQIRTGENLLDLDLSGKKPGIYLVNIAMEGQRAQSIKLIVSDQ